MQKCRNVLRQSPKRLHQKPETFLKKPAGFLPYAAGAADHRKNCAEKEAGTGFRPWRSQTKDISLDLTTTSTSLLQELFSVKVQLGQIKVNNLSFQ